MNIYSEMGSLKNLLDEKQTEVHDIKTALSFVKHLSEHNIPFELKYNNCPLGEYWYFKLT